MTYPSLRYAALLSLLLLIARSVFALPDIVFITQPPHPSDFATANATFGNQRASLDSIPRGGDLYIRYSNGTLKNITAAAGFGRSGFQGVEGIAVRDPAVHWNGTKVVFSMVIGSPTARYQTQNYRWQLYEASKLAEGETPTIVKVANQPSSYNNVMPVYGTDERIIFVSDHPQAGKTHTYPQRDEYESTATNTGLWSLDPRNGDLKHLDHAPSGDFSPTIDSFGRVIFTRWDHLQRDQQNRCSNQEFGAFNYAHEDEGAQALDNDTEHYPEQRAVCDENRSANTENHSFNHFLPWQMHEDGTEMETINHIGRHELASYIPKTIQNDPNIEEFYGQYSRANHYSVNNFLQIYEDAQNTGVYFGISAPEFGTHASGQIVKMTAPPTLSADQVIISPITHPDTANTDDTPTINHIGLSRDPLPLSDGTLIAAHSPSTLADSNIGSATAPASRYSYRLKSYSPSGEYYRPDSLITTGITKTISYWSPDVLISYDDAVMWDLQPREIRVRTRPAILHSLLPNPENAIFQQVGVDVNLFRTYLNDNNLALIVSRNVTARDHLDHQQPFNLEVEGSNTRTEKNSGLLYSVAHLQIFQGDLIRGYGGIINPQLGRRVLARPLHSVSSNLENPTGPVGSAKIASDGSIAAFVPARRALTYQLTNRSGGGVVRERLWLTFQPGEIRVCASCHGVNSFDQAGKVAPTNQPEALRILLEHWKGLPHEAPIVTLAVTPLPKVKGRSSLKGGAKALITVKGENTQAVHRTFTLMVKAGQLSCGSLAQITIDSSGSTTVQSKRLPLLKKKISLTFSIDSAGTTIATRSIPIQATFRGRIAEKNVCSALRRSFR